MGTSMETLLVGCINAPASFQDLFPALVKCLDLGSPFVVPFPDDSEEATGGFRFGKLFLAVGQCGAVGKRVAIATLSGGEPMGARKWLAESTDLNLYLWPFPLFGNDNVWDTGRPEPPWPPKPKCFSILLSEIYAADTRPTRMSFLQFIDDLPKDDARDYLATVEEAGILEPIVRCGPKSPNFTKQLIEVLTRTVSDLSNPKRKRLEDVVRASLR